MARRYDRRTFIRGAALGGRAIVFLGAPPANARKLRLARDATFDEGGPIPLPAPSAPLPAPPGTPGVPPLPGVLSRAS